MATLSNRIIVLTGKSCEPNVTLGPINKLIPCKQPDHITNDDDYAYFNDVIDYKDRYNEFNKTLLITDEHNIHLLPDAEHQFGIVSYNSDRVLTRIKVFVSYISKLRSDDLKDIPVNDIVANVRNKYSALVEFPQDTKVKEVQSILFTTVPSLDEYYCYIKPFISRSNYTNRARDGNVKKVDIIFVITDNMVDAYNTLLSEIITCEKKYKQLVESATIQFDNKKNGCDVIPIVKE